MTLRALPSSPYLFAPICRVEGRLRVAPLEGRLRVPKRVLTSALLQSAFSRSVVSEGLRFRFVVESGTVRGLLVVPEHTDARSMPQRLDIRAPRGRAWSGIALFDAEGELIAERGGLPDAYRRLLPGLRGEVVVGSVWVRTEFLTGDACGRLLLVHVDPISEVAEPMFARLTASQVDVCLFAAQGLGVADIARARHCSPETVRSHLRDMYERLGVATRAELVPVAQEVERWGETLFDELASRVADASHLTAFEMRAAG